MNPPGTRDILVVRGGKPLHGEIRVNGAKNAALKHMAASLLAEGRTVVNNVPAIADVPIMGQVLTGLGARVAIDEDPGGMSYTVTIEIDEPGWQAPRRFVTMIRASVAVLGPLVGRVGRARIAPPGGDRIGARRIDMHLTGLEQMGAQVTHADGEIEVEVPGGRLHGADITLDFPSVGATENLLMAAVLAGDQTVIDNAAREPEIQDLCTMLIAMGARIEGVGTPTLTVEGVPALHPVTHDTIPDRIEAGTFAFAAAITGGDLRIQAADPGHLKLPLTKLAAIGADIEETDGWLRVRASDELQPVDVVTLPYPGFPTDLQPQLMVVLSQAHGTSIVTENVFESRFEFVTELTRLGADIEIDGHHAIIRGPRPLTGGRARSLDVRAGAACILAGLVAEGETRIDDVHHIDRGYAAIAERLQGVGADIERVV
ncbi:MAG: UDP-N-acetylglucosamine 1-carboxyvinyltransferase [Actinobacteria bacterium]|nr:UDP-N-acetylglucosamine 1-carboxyvinyltransferase [Actinomycetota bacterium]